MTDYDSTNKGTLGKNKDKTKDTQPDYRGQINVQGKDFWLSAWLKTNGSTGEKFFSIAVQPKDQSVQQGATGAASQPSSTPHAPADDFVDSSEPPF